MGVSQTVVKRSLRSLHQARLGALTTNVNSHASNHDIGMEISQKSHWVVDIASNIGPLSRASLIRLVSVCVSLSSSRVESRDSG